MQQVKRTHAVRCPVCGKGRVIDAAADVDPGRLHLYGPEHAEVYPMSRTILNFRG